MKVFSYKKRYAILPSNDPLVLSKQYAPSDLKKFLVDTDIYQGQILKATIPAGGEIITRNRNHTIHVEKFDEQSEVYIAIDEYLWSIEFPQGASVYTEKVQEAGGGSDGEITLQDKTITENGTYKADEGFGGLGNVTVDVEKEIVVNDEKTYNDFKGVVDGTATNVTVPEGATKIKSSLFSSSTSLTAVTMPNSVEEIGQSAFQSCSNLTSVKLSDNLKKIGGSAFNYCSKMQLTRLPSGITSIGSSAFSGCSKIALTELPNGLTKIESNTFQQCGELALTSLPSGIIEILDGAFRYCNKIALTNFPENLDYIGSFAFHTCSLLEEITFNATRLDSNAFYECPNLKKVTFKGKSLSISSIAFKSCSHIDTINVPWAEGEVANAPWGATKATINYNYTGE